METNTKASPSHPVSDEDVLFIALEIGEHILRNGGEISRAEDSIIRICRAYGAVHVDVTAIFSMIALTVDYGGTHSTATRRISNATSNNLGKLSKLNNLSRYICANRPSKDEFIKRMDEINRTSRINLTTFVIGSALAALGFTIFFSDLGAGFTMEIVLGILLDALIAGILAVPLALISNHLSKTKTNSMIANFLVCFIGGVLALGISRFVPCRADMIMIGNIMNFIPGVAMTNAFRDLFGGDIMSGFFRLCMVLIDAIIIAAGYAVAILIFGGVV